MTEADNTQTHLMHMTFWPAMFSTIIGFWIAVLVQRYRIAHGHERRTGAG